MIVFQAEHVEPILKGEKTETFRLWGKPRVKVGSIHKAKTFMFSPEFFAELEITKIVKMKASKLTKAAAKRRGYPSVKAYKEAFTRINRLKKWDGKLEGYAVTFKVVKYES